VEKKFTVFPLGKIQKAETSTCVEVNKKYQLISGYKAPIFVKFLLIVAESIKNDYVHLCAFTCVIEFKPKTCFISKNKLKLSSATRVKPKLGLFAQEI
jgi:hypothetical protein